MRSVTKTMQRAFIREGFRRVAATMAGDTAAQHAPIGHKIGARITAEARAEGETPQF